MVLVLRGSNGRIGRGVKWIRRLVVSDILISLALTLLEEIEEQARLIERDVGTTIGVMVLFGCWFWVVAWVVGAAMEATRVAYGLGLVGFLLFTVAGRVYYKIIRGRENRQSGHEGEKEWVQRSEVKVLKESKSG
jgi:hypothetical protein